MHKKDEPKAKEIDALDFERIVMSSPEGRPWEGQPEVYRRAFGRWWDERAKGWACQGVWSAKKGSLEDAQDPVQESFVSLYRALAQGQIQENVAGYVWKVGRHAALRDLTQEKKDKEGRREIAEEVSPLDEEEAWKELLSPLLSEIGGETFVRENPEEDALFWYLQSIQGRKLKEIAGSAEIPISTVQNRIKEFEKSRLWAWLSRRAFQEVLGYLVEIGQKIRLWRDDDEIQPERLGRYLGSEEGCELLAHLRGSHLEKKDPTKPKLPRSPRFPKTVGSFLWLAHYVRPKLSWNELAEQTGFAPAFLGELTREAYPMIVFEYLRHQKTKKANAGLPS